MAEVDKEQSCRAILKISYLLRMRGQRLDRSYTVFLYSLSALQNISLSFHDMK